MNDEDDNTNVLWKNKIWESEANYKSCKFQYFCEGG